MNKYVFIATAKNWNGEKQNDAKGKRNIVLTPYSGTSPRTLNVIAGTVAESEGFEHGKLYAVGATENEPYTNPKTGVTSRSFSFGLIAELDAMKALESVMADNLVILVTPGAVVKATAEPVELGVEE
jgi:hypothetical protein